MQRLKSFKEGLQSAAAECKVAAQSAATECKVAAGKVKQELASKAGVRERLCRYTGGIAFRNELPGAVVLSFCQSALPRSRIETLKLDSGAEYIFDPSETKDFDFVLDANSAKARKAHCTVIRGASYKIRLDYDGLDFDAVGSAAAQAIVVEMFSPPERTKTDRLANTPGLSFAFSASGWLFVYQLGAAECLQNHGITRNPHVRVAGASGGALAVITMLYGCDMSELRDIIKARGQSVYKDVTQAANLRLFILEAMKTVAKDGSVQHPAIQSGRVEVAVSESCFETTQSFSSRFRSFAKGESKAVKGRRMKSFEKTSDAVIALLASATMGISGLPFTYKNDEGKEVKVADGAFTDFMPVIDEFSVKVRPFTDGLNILGKKPDVAPTELVPPNYGVWPPASSTIDHFYELGYRDMDAWIEHNLEARLQEIREHLEEAPADLPPVEFTCTDDGMTWIEEVLQAVPINWGDQLRRRPSSVLSAEASCPSSNLEDLNSMVLAAAEVTLEPTFPSSTLEELEAAETAVAAVAIASSRQPTCPSSTPEDTRVAEAAEALVAVGTSAETTCPSSTLATQIAVVAVAAESPIQVTCPSSTPEEPEAAEATAAMESASSPDTACPSLSTLAIKGAMETVPAASTASEEPKATMTSVVAAATLSSAEPACPISNLENAATAEAAVEPMGAHNFSPLLRSAREGPSEDDSG